LKLRQAPASRPIPVVILGDLLGRLDQMFLLENGAYTDEMQKRLDEYRRAPARKAALAELAYPGDRDDLRAHLDGMAFP
jgi:hypothetical protein|tara:strand:+ start:5136 stop:5372 length:237 start_codon:yes stop_codon:yes gene_type:complete